MKKLFMFAALLLCAIAANAQKVVEDNVSGTNTVSGDTKHGNDPEVNGLNSGVGANVAWYKQDDILRFGVDLIFDNLMFTGFYWGWRY